MPLEASGLERRPLYFFWLVDVSGSMSGEKIATLNHAIREAIPPTQQAAAENTQATLFMQALSFGSGCQWINRQPVPVEQYTWQDLTTNGVTDMGKAFEMLGAEMTAQKLPRRGFQPIIVLLTDGEPTDDWKKGLDILLANGWARRAKRVAIAIGDDANISVLEAFTGNSELVFRANSAATLANLINFVSVTLSQTASQGKAAPLPPADNDDDDDEWDIPVSRD